MLYSSDGFRSIVSCCADHVSRSKNETEAPSLVPPVSPRGRGGGAPSPKAQIRRGFRNTLNSYRDHLDFGRDCEEIRGSLIGILSPLSVACLCGHRSCMHDAAHHVDTCTCACTMKLRRTPNSVGHAGVTVLPYCPSEFRSARSLAHAPGLEPMVVRICRMIPYIYPILREPVNPQ